MKLQAALIAVMMFVPIFAQTSNAGSGVNPDSVLWGIDVALDKISLALTLNPEKRAEKALNIAQERLMEVKTMAEANNVKAASKAEAEHDSTIKEVESSIEKLKSDHPEEQIQKELELESKIKEHKTAVERVKTGLKVKVQVEGELSSEQRALLDQFLLSLSNSTNRVEMKVQNQREDTKIKLKEETGESETEINQRIQKLEIEHGLLDTNIKVIGKVFGNQTYVEIENEYDTDLTNSTEVLDEFLNKFYLDTNKADALLKIETSDETETKQTLKIKIETDDEGSDVNAKMRFLVNTTQRDQVVDAITAKTRLTRSEAEVASQIKDESGQDKGEQDKIKIKVETEGNTSKVRIKLGDQKTRLELNTTNRTKILSIIAAQLGISTEEINKFVKFESGDSSEDSEHMERENESGDNDSMENNETKEHDKKETVKIEDDKKEHSESLEASNSKNESIEDSNNHKTENNSDSVNKTTEDSNNHKTENNSDSVNKTTEDSNNHKTENNSTLVNKTTRHAENKNDTSSK